MLPSIITKLFRSRSNLPAPVTGHKAEIQAELPLVWGDDSELRALAQDSRDGITNWVVANDLRELFGNVAAYNQSRPESEHIRVEVMGEVSEKIAEWREKNLHNPEKNGMKKQEGPLVLNGDAVLKAFGPSSVGGMRLRVGEQTAAMSYHHNVIETYIDIETPAGESKKIYFTGGYVEEMAQTLSLR